MLNCNEETLLFKQFEIRNENEGKIYTIAYNNDAKDFNICATEYFTKLKMHLCSCNRRNLKYVLRHKIFRGNFIIYIEKVDRNSILQEEDEVNYDYKPKFIDMDLTIDEYIKEKFIVIAEKLKSKLVEENIEFKDWQHQGRGLKFSLDHIDDSKAIVKKINQLRDNHDLNIQC